MKVKWKMQHVRNGCASACQTMLLTEYGINLEDRNLVELSLMPYLVRYSKDHKSFSCGTKIQNHEIYSIVPNSFGFKYYDLFLKNWDEYLLEATKLNRPFMTTASIKYLNSPDYKKYRDSEVRGGHAVVVEKIENDIFYILDPAAGLPRDNEHKFNDIKERVYYKMTFAEMKECLEYRRMYLIGYIVKEDVKPKSYTHLLEESISVSEFLPSVLKDLILDFNEQVNYQNFYKLLSQIVYPYSVDLHASLCCISEQTDDVKETIDTLKTIFDKTVKIQYKYKEDSGLNLESYFEFLTTKFDKFTELYLKILKDKRNNS